MPSKTLKTPTPNDPCMKRRRACQRPPSPRGMGLLEALIALGVSAIIVGAVASALKYFNRGVTTIRVSSGRDALFSRLQKAAGMPSNLAWTLANTPSPLGPCLSPTNVASSCVSGQPIEFSLFQPPAVAGGPPTLLSGTSAAPARYTADGAPCSTLGADCVLEAVTSFIPECQGGAPTCAQAIAIGIIATLRQNAGTTLQNGTLKQLAARTTNPPIPIQTREIAGLGAQTCPAGTIFSGTDSFGNPICNTAPPGDCGGFPNFLSKVDFGNNTSQCASSPSSSGSCNYPTDVAVGFDMASNQIHCRPAPSPQVILATGDLVKSVAGCSALHTPGGSAANCHWSGMASCPTGYVLTGGGGSCQMSVGGVTLESHPVPAAPPVQWSLDCCSVCAGGNPSTFSNGVYAVCMKVSP